uniref:DUF2029 domain-containing protein n=1 Tax=candidate division WWE3 bacterium TaxID=2053526 RepID=A0A7C4TKA5_UNCKA
MIFGLGKSLQAWVSHLLKNPIEIIKIAILVLIILFSSYEKYKVFDKTGGDFATYKKASREFLSGINPYDYTVRSYLEEGSTRRSDTTKPRENDLSHGYAYLPGLLYIQAPLYKLSEIVDFPLQRLWSLPVLLADIGVSILLIFALYKKSYLASLIAVAAWSYNPFFLINQTYTNSEPYPVFFLLLALLMLEKYEKLSAVFFATSVAFKTFPLMLLPIFLLKSKNILRFLLIGLSVFIVISLPFMKSFEDFWTYIQGSLLVHGERELQGRPLLSYLQYYTGWQFFQVSYFKFYAFAALITGPILVFMKRKENVHKHIQAMLTLSCFYVLTPILSRTHLIWFIPFYLLGMYELTNPTSLSQSPKNDNKRLILYTFVIILFYVLYALYLSQWGRGFRYIGDEILL